MIVLFSATLWNLADYPRFALTSVNEPVLVILVWVLSGPMSHLKLDELIRAIKNARNELVYLEDLPDEELKKLEEQFKTVRKRAENDGSPSRHTEPSMK